MDGDGVSPGEATLVFYSLSTCVMCKRAREYLEERGLRHRIVLVDQLPAEERDARRSDLGRRHGIWVVFPALEIDGRRIVLGFFRGAWDQALAEREGT